MIIVIFWYKHGTDHEVQETPIDRLHAQTFLDAAPVVCVYGVAPLVLVAVVVAVQQEPHHHHNEREERRHQETHARVVVVRQQTAADRADDATWG